MTNNNISELITLLINTAKSRGINQSQLAELAGLSAVGLSKAKSRGDIRASTLASMANQLGLELKLVPYQSRNQTAESIKAGTFFTTSSAEPIDKPKSVKR